MKNKHFNIYEQKQKKPFFKQIVESAMLSIRKKGIIGLIIKIQRKIEFKFLSLLAPLIFFKTKKHLIIKVTNIIIFVILIMLPGLMSEQ